MASWISVIVLISRIANYRVAHAASSSGEFQSRIKAGSLVLTKEIISQ
jgi:hypothetical protein